MIAGLASLLLLLPAIAAPALLNHQGRMAVDGVNFEGAGRFKFSLVNATGTTTYWSNDGTGTAGSEPAAAVALTVTRGLYAVLLGDTFLTNMSAVPVTVFDNADVRLRVWFDDGTTGFQQITPDQRLAAAPYAINAAKADVAATVPDGSITGAKIAPGAVANSSLTNSSFTLNPGPGLSGGGLFSLGGSVTLNNTGVLSLTGGGGITVSAATGAVALGSNATTANIPNTIVLRDGSGAITGKFIGDGSGLTGIPGGSTMNLADLIAAPVNPVVAWGDNSDGQNTVPPLAGVAAISAGSTHRLVLLDDGTVVSWGAGPAVPAGLTEVTQIAAGCGYNLARKSDGTVVAWGVNTFGQTTVPAGLATAISVAAGEKHSLALRANGTVAAWGDNTFGQTNTPGAATSVTAIACGYDHNLALKADGTVVAWGRSDAGQITIPAGLTGVVAIGAGAYHSLAVKNDGTVVAWGWDLGYQSTVPADLTGVTKVAGGYSFSMALKTDGTIVTWGDNSHGQSEIPPGTTSVTSIAASASHALALRAGMIPARVARLDQENVFTEKIGIGRTPAANALEVEGNASKSTAGSWLSNSDRRIKTEIQPVTGALEKLDQVRLVDFRYSDDYRAAHPGIENKRYLNVIAQEFAKVFPDDVKSSGEKLPDGSPVLQVDTYPLTIYSAAAVQELHRENQALKKQLADQDERLRKLEAALTGK